MKRLLLSALMITLSFAICLSQTGKITSSIWGFTTQTSSDNQYLKVTKVIVGSLAQLSGIKINDKVTQINGQSVSGITDPLGLLNQYSGQYLNLKINRLAKTIDIEVPLIKNVTNINDYLTEGVLYSKMIRGDEIPCMRVGGVKLSFLSDNTKDMLKYKTYDFEFTSAENPLLEKKIFTELGNQLNELGMSRSVENPDLIILMNYYSGSREKYTPPQQIISTRIEKSYNWFWGPVQVPVIESKTVKDYTTVTYMLSLSIKFLDATEIGKSKLPPVVWEGSMTRTSENELLIINECSKAFEVLLYQFPVVWIEVPENFLLPSYFYTGIVYDRNDIQTIFDVVPGSPAANAGIIKGDKILSIIGDKIPSKFETIMKWEYLNGIQYGYEANMRYAEKAGAGLRYLIWAHSSENQNINVNIKRGSEKMSFDIMPLEKQLIRIDK